MGAFEMRRVGFCFHVIVMHLSARGNDRQQIREAEARWLMPALSDWQRQTHHCFSSLASLVINPVCLVLKVEAPLSAGSWSCALKSILKNKVIFRSMQLWSLCLVGLNSCGLLEEMVSLLSILCAGDIHRMSKCIWVHVKSRWLPITVLAKSSVNVNSKTRYLDEVLQIKTLLKPWPAFPSPSASHSPGRRRALVVLHSFHTNAATFQVLFRMTACTGISPDPFLLSLPTQIIHGCNHMLMCKMSAFAAKSSKWE